MLTWHSHDGKGPARNQRVFLSWYTCHAQISLLNQRLAATMMSMPVTVCGSSTATCRLACARRIGAKPPSHSVTKQPGRLRSTVRLSGGR